VRLLHQSIATLEEIAYLDIVKGRMKHTTIGLLLAAYLLVAFASHFEVLGRLVNTAGQSHQIAAAKKSRPIDSRLYWTQKKHLFSSRRNVESPSEAAFSIPESPHDRTFAATCISAFGFLSRQPLRLPYRPRDPPSA
jgi:hypothetical protein